MIFAFYTKNNLMKNSLLLFVFLISYMAFGQEKRVIDGKEYFVHEVVKGNTLYSISKQYDVSLSEILNNNPEAEKGINIGQKIYIPIANKTIESPVVTPDNGILDGGAFEDESVKLTRFHVAEKQETLYGIAKMYDVTIYDIVKLNPGIEAGIQVEQTIIIPDPANHSNASTSKNVVYYDTVITHKVAKKETLYSISKRYMVPQKDIVAYNGIKNNAIQPNETLKIPLKKDAYKNIEVREVPILELKEGLKTTNEFIFEEKSNYKIVIVAPLGLTNKAEKMSGIATEFYMGVEYALDSLEKKGLNADVHVVDCSMDTISLKKKLKEYQDADIIIGPFAGETMDVTAAFAAENQIKVINPLVGYTKPLRNNPYLFNAMTSDITLMEGMAKYISDSVKSGKILVVKPTSADTYLYNAFRNKLQILNATTGVKFVECDVNDFIGYFAKGVNTTIIYPSRDFNAITKFMNTLHQNNKKLGSAIVHVYGTKEWTNMDKIKNYYKNTYNFHFSMANDLDYSYAKTKQLLRGFRYKYNTDLTKIMIQGFDVMYYFGNKYFLKEEPGELIMNDFTITPISSTDGSENKSTFIYKQVDNDYILLKKIK